MRIIPATLRVCFVMFLLHRIISGQLTKTSRTLDDLDLFDMIFFHNCPIVMEIITGSHIFILFLPPVGT